MGHRILCVAEKPAIAKAVAGHLASGQYQTQHTRSQYIKNYIFDYNFRGWGNSSVKFTSVIGHIVAQEFGPEYRKWDSCDPGRLFDAPIYSSIHEDKKAIAENIEQLSRQSDVLYIWTDCDREGENIGAEVRDIARKGNPRIDVKRAKFSNTERNHIIQAANSPGTLDERQIAAVSARIEIDLRSGASFTRVLTLKFRSIDPSLQLISYGSCQFPTLGFVVDRYWRVKNFVSEPFWGIRVTHRKDGVKVNFNWRRGHLFDRMAVVILYERCLVAGTAEVTKMDKRPTSKWKPLPLTTVELQKNGSRFLRMDSQRVMKAAEELYTKGWISYPRTETDQFDRNINLQAIIQRQTQDGMWGGFAQSLINGGFNQPRNGRNNDKAHPPIHPVNYVSPTQLSEDQRKVYEFVVRRFLACCSEDAKGEQSTVEIEYGSEYFHASGLIVLQRNYLDVYPYDKWESSQQLPQFTVGETFVPSEAKITEGKTTPPGYLTEPELIALMDANGIGTDATMAEHIAKIKERNYVQTRFGSRTSNRAGQTDSAAEDAPANPTRGSSSRGRGRGRAGAAVNATRGRGGGGVEEFIPTTLGVALIEGYENLHIETSLSKPFLRKEMELRMKAICDGEMTRNDVVERSLEQYRDVYVRTTQHMDVLEAAFRKYIQPGTTNR